MGLLHGTNRWKLKRLQQLQAEPLCRLCRAVGRIVAARVADHIEPHRDDPIKFWNGALQSLCFACHNSVKQAFERTGVMRGHDANGWPLDPLHAWNKARGDIFSGQK